MLEAVVRTVYKVKKRKCDEPSLKSTCNLQLAPAILSAFEISLTSEMGILN